MVSHSIYDDFLNRIRHPAAADLVRAIKSFIVSFSLHTNDPKNDSRKIQDFLMSMEATISDHPLWANASEEEIENALEGLEKYIMTKLFNRTFGSYADDIELDAEMSKKICLLQHFVQPCNLDVPEMFQNAALCLIAAKELQKINAFRAPREKLLCVVNCCQVINNFLLNVPVSKTCMPAGADVFLSILIYVTIKANPPRLHSNLRFIQLFRRHSKLVSEVDYYLTNLISAKSFIANVNAGSLSMEESEFESKMQSAKLAISGIKVEPGILRPSENASPIVGVHCKVIHLEGKTYPFMEAEVGELTVGDVHNLLGLYKRVVARYTKLSQALRQLSLDENQLISSVREDSPTMGLEAEGNILGNKNFNEVQET